jgi:AraC family transcriptional regulator, ethanolamine operon transcriptional activator
MLFDDIVIRFAQSEVYLESTTEGGAVMTPTNLIEAADDRLLIDQRLFSDIDQQANCLTGYQQRYQQLSCGKFFGKCSKVLLGPDLGLYQESLNQVLDQSGAVPNDRYMVICLMNPTGDCKINGRTFMANQVFYAGPGTSIAGISGPGVDSVVINLGRDVFEAVLSGCYPDFRPERKLRGFGFLESCSENAQNLLCLVDEVLSMARNQRLNLTEHRIMAALRCTILEMIADQLFRALSISGEDRSTERSRRFQVVRDVCDVINARPRSDIPIASLCRQLGVSRRTIEYSMRDCIGQSPGAYRRRIKLNGIRRDLLDPEKKALSIGDIAAEWGFWHLSRFAQQYRFQFHELPSETRHRSGGQTD